MDSIQTETKNRHLFKVFFEIMAYTKKLFSLFLFVECFFSNILQLSTANDFLNNYKNKDKKQRILKKEKLTC